MKFKAERIKAYFASEHWKWHDTFLGILIGIVLCSVAILITTVDAADLWDLFRFHVKDMGLLLFSAGMTRACWILMKKRDYQKKVDTKAAVVHQNWFKWVIMFASLYSLALVNPEFAKWIITAFWP